MMTTLREQLTVIVPTCNRPERLLRVLRYYSASRCPAPMRVLDSSTTPLDARALEPFVARGADVAVLSYPATVLPLAKMLNGLERVSTPYAVIWADDDFLVPGAFEEGVRLLGGYPDISVVHGQSGLFRMDAAQIQWVAPYPQRAILDETASARLQNHFRQCSVMFYSIARTEALRKNFEQICRLGLDWHTWGELALGGLAVIQGKAYLMDRLYMMREAHGGMFSATIHAVRSIDAFDWLVDPAVSRELGSYEMFRDCLVPELVRQDRLNAASAREAIKQAFWPYLVAQMEAKWRGPVVRRNSAMAARLRNTATQVPGLRRAWRAVRSRLPDQAFSLEALRRRSSPYHAHFMAVYRALIDAHEQMQRDEPNTEERWVEEHPVCARD